MIQKINDVLKNKKDAIVNIVNDKLLELMTISRSRKHITSYYGDKGVGQFPEKNKPDTYNSDIDTKKELLHFRETNELLEALILSVYTPTRYIKEESQHIQWSLYNNYGRHNLPCGGLADE